jgi:hypothetical protein
MLIPFSFLFRTLQDFAFLWPQANNRLFLLPMDRVEERRLDGRGLRVRSRSNRPLYIRPYALVTTFIQVKKKRNLKNKNVIQKIKT